MRSSGIIIGAGIVGSALAYELSRQGVRDLVVLDPDLEGPLSSTERNAGGVRHLWQLPVNVELSRHSIRFFESIRTEIGFQQTGYTWLFGKEKQDAGTRLLDHTRRMKLEYEQLDVAELRRRYPFIDKTDDLAFAIFGKKDGLLNSNALKLYFRKKATESGVKFVDRSWALKLHAGTKAKVEVATFESAEAAEKALQDPIATLAPQKTLEADFVVLAAGAWSGVLLKSLGKEPFVEPIRRQICLFKSEDLDLSPYGMIVDTSGVYFHPEGGNILAGRVLKEEPAGFRFHYDADFFEGHVWPALYERSSKLEKLKWVTGWGGLYSYTPDISGLLGSVPGCPGVYEAHSFTGHGIMQCYGAAVALTELILQGRYQTIDASPLSRLRFEKPDPATHLVEHLHI